jgi:hypothetical protein
LQVINLTSATRAVSLKQASDTMFRNRFVHHNPNYRVYR